MHYSTKHKLFTVNYTAAEHTLITTDLAVWFSIVIVAVFPLWERRAQSPPGVLVQHLVQLHPHRRKGQKSGGKLVIAMLKNEFWGLPF